MGKTDRRWLPYALTAGLVALLAGVIFLFRDRTPILRAEDLRKAQEVWQRNGFADYTIKVLKEADRLGRERFVTIVTGKRATQLLLDGNPLPAKDTYSVPGLFDTIERELEIAAEKEVSPGQPRGAVLKAIFDDKLGLPLVFKRIAPEDRSFLLKIEEFKVPENGVLYPAH